jgi:hypothetical protein
LLGNFLYQAKMPRAVFGAPQQAEKRACAESRLRVRELPMSRDHRVRKVRSTSRRLNRKPLNSSGLRHSREIARRRAAEPNVVTFVHVAGSKRERSFDSF